MTPTTPRRPACIVIWDGSAEAEAALRWGSVHAHESGGPVVITRVVDAAGDSAGTPVGVALAALESRAELVQAEYPDMAVATDVAGGEPAVMLRRLLDRADATLVIGSSNHPARHDKPPSYLSARIASAARGIVVVVPTSMPRGFGQVVGVDGSVAASFALDAAATECARTGMRLHVVHVWDDPRGDTGADLARDYVEWSGAAHAGVLEGARARVAELHPEVDTLVHLIRGDALAVLRRFSTEADGLFVGAPRFGEWPHQVLGPIASDLVITAACPLVLIPVTSVEAGDAAGPPLRTRDQA